jgi:hypothetical protein
MIVRLPHRLLAALMLLPAMFGIGDAIITSPRAPQAIVCPYRKERRAPQPVAEQLPPAIPSRAIRPIAPPRDAHFPALFLHYGLFQRPPPSGLLST